MAQWYISVIRYYFVRTVSRVLRAMVSYTTHENTEYHHQISMRGFYSVLDEIYGNEPYYFISNIIIFQYVGSRIYSYSRSILAVEVLGALNGEDIEHKSAIWKQRVVPIQDYKSRCILISSNASTERAHTRTHTHTHTLKRIRIGLA